jgi:hypothetical protein
MVHKTRLSNTIPEWFTTLITAVSRCWPQVLRAGINTDDWGLAADLARYHTFNEWLNDIDNTLHGLENMRRTILDKHHAATTCLACAQASQRLGTLRTLTNEEGAYRSPLDSRVGPTRTHGSHGCK